MSNQKLLALADRLEPQVEYDRELIADMLDVLITFGDKLAGFTYRSINDQIALLRAADNRDAAGVRTVNTPGDAEAVPELDRIRGLAYVPGAWRCPKCSLRLIAQKLSTLDGGMTANNDPQECANGCGPLWRVTEREDRQEAQRFAIELSERPAPPVVDASAIASEVYDWMISIEPNGNFLPASVACDYAGKQRFKAALAQRINAALGKGER